MGGRGGAARGGRRDGALPDDLRRAPAADGRRPARARLRRRVRADWRLLHSGQRAPLLRGLARLRLRDPRRRPRGRDAGRGVRPQRRGLPALLLLRVGRAHPGGAAAARCVPGGPAVTADACPACGPEWSAPELYIADCGLTVASLLADQFFRGWTVLALKRHATELWQLEPAERAGLIQEVSRV